jgi:hypothetical protein
VKGDKAIRNTGSIKLEAGYILGSMEDGKLKKQKSDFDFDSLLNRFQVYLASSLTHFKLVAMKKSLGVVLASNSQCNKANLSKVIAEAILGQKFGHSPGSDFKYLVSIDIGLRNIAATVFSLGHSRNEISVLKWVKEKLPDSKDNSFVSSGWNAVVANFIEQLLVSNGIPIPKDQCMFVYERMFIQGGNMYSRQFAKLLGFENILAGLACGNCQSLSPKYLLEYFAWDLGNGTSNAKRRKAKKTFAVELTMDMVAHPAKSGLSMNERVCKVFVVNEKKDDLADCFLLGLAYLMHLQRRLHTFDDLAVKIV